MCEDEGTRGGDGTAEATRCGIRGDGRDWANGSGGRTVDDKVGEGDEEMLGKAHLRLGGG